MYRGKKGFTLMELLVVVLIIGILAAIALPKYKKAVQKSRLAQLDVMLNAADKNISSYIMANGAPTEQVVLSGPDSVGVVDISKNCEEDTCYTRSGSFSVLCFPDGTCGMGVDTAATSPSTNDDNWLDGTRIVFMRDSSTGEWYIDSIE